MAFTTYSEVFTYLYANLPMFQRVGAAAYKRDLSNTLMLCERLGNPHHNFPTVHIAGTNGKGSTSHMLASVLQSAGYKTGLYTSPHLKEFTERIRVDGQEVAPEFIVDFVNRIHSVIDEIHPSFFEITVAMAFAYFARETVDIAIIEVGLGGRLDSTNVITPLVSVITNIGWDHKDLLGDTLEKIANEKAGIIKNQVPVIVSQRQPGIDQVFIARAAETQSPVSFADEVFSARLVDQRLTITDKSEATLVIESFPLPGLYQEKNVPGVIRCLDELKKQGWKIPDKAIRDGLRDVVKQTSLKGRWQKISDHPVIVCDTGHNVDGVGEVVRMLRLQSFQRLWMVIGMVNDKDIANVLNLLPREAFYFFCEAKIPRALRAELLKKAAAEKGLQGEVVPDVNQALAQAKSRAGENDFIFVGGSTFVVAEVNGI